MTAGIAPFHSGAGVVGALLVGIAARALTLGTGQIAFALARPMSLRAIIAVAFAIPAACRVSRRTQHVADRRAVTFLARVLTWAGAVAIGCTAWARMTVLAEPLPLRPPHAVSDDLLRSRKGWLPCR